MSVDSSERSVFGSSVVLDSVVILRLPEAFFEDMPTRSLRGSDVSQSVGWSVQKHAVRLRRNFTKMAR